MAKFKFTLDEINNLKQSINTAISQDKAWDNERNTPLKKRIKTVMRQQANFCAYCLASFQGSHSITIDIEHILPKAQYNKFTFSLKNLTISCKRCNLQIKRSNTNFLTDNFNPKKPFSKKYYKLTHPNLDKNNNLELYDINISGTFRIKKYSIKNNNKKAKYTYDYFKLSQIEEESINSVQGIEKVQDLLSAILTRL